MLLKNPLSVAFIVFLALSLSCDDTDTPSFQGTYPEVEVTYLGVPRVFNNKGEWKGDPTLINPEYWLDTSSLNFYPRYYIQYSFIDTVIFTGREAALRGNSGAKKCLVTQESADFVLIRNDTTNSYTYGDEKTHHISYWLGQVKPEVHTESLMSSTGGQYTFRWSGTEKYVLRGYNDRFILPYVAYSLRQPPHYYSTNQGLLNNHLEPEFYKNLKDDEVITILEFQVLFKKKK